MVMLRPSIAVNAVLSSVSWPQMAISQMEPTRDTLTPNVPFPRHHRGWTPLIVPATGDPFPSLALVMSNKLPAAGQVPLFSYRSCCAKWKRVFMRLNSDQPNSGGLSLAYAGDGHFPLPCVSSFSPPYLTSERRVGAGLINRLGLGSQHITHCSPLGHPSYHGRY